MASDMRINQKLNEMNSMPEQPHVVKPKCETLQILKGQKALVTGASSGIGKAIAIAFGVAGADVVVNYIGDENDALDVTEIIQSSGGNAIAIRADVSQEDQVSAMFSQMLDVFGTIDILVNNAGIQQDSPIETMSLKQWEQVIAVNLTGQFLCAREAIREFKR